MDKKKLPTYAAVLVALLFFAGGVCALNEISLYTPDSTRYLVWANSLASFSGYRDVTTPEPIRYVVHAPLYSLFLVPAAMLFPGSIIAAKLFTLSIGAGLLLLFYLWSARSVGKWFGLFGALLLACNPLFFLYSGEVLSDVPFVASAVLSWMLIDRVDGDKRFRPAAAGALALAVASALLLREIGIAVLLSSVIALLVRKRRKEAGLVFFVSAIFYGAWYARNELVVAPLENPLLTNARILSYHFMTPGDASLFEEFAARIANNAAIYAGQLGDLLFAPVYFSMQYDVIAPAEPAMAWMTGVLGFLRYPIAFFAAGSVLFGFWTDLRKSDTALIRLLFLGIYGAVIVTYPINDIRFLLPILLLAIYYCLVGWSAHRQGGSPAARVSVTGKAAVGLSLLFLAPNLLWNTRYARNSAAFTRSPVSSIESAPSVSSAPPESSARFESSTPTHFTKPFKLAGEWVTMHTDTGTVLMTQWKDLALWVGNRKVLNVDQTILLDDFENQLRDYRVRILVSQVKRSKITEFEIPMHQSRRFAFTLINRIGNTEIYRVSERTAGTPAAEDDTPFKRALSSLEQGGYAAAETTLSSLWQSSPQNMTALFMLATVKGCALKIEEADSLFGLLRSYPQSGIYLVRAAAQQRLLESLRALGSAPPGPQRAEMVTSAAAGYWNAGLRHRARQLIGEAFREDSISVAAMVFGFHFALKQDDLPEARAMTTLLGRIAPAHPLAAGFRTILALRDSLDIDVGNGLRQELSARLARVYFSIGLQEDAIDCLLQGMVGGREDAAESIMLADLYVGKKRYGPARSVLLALLERYPGDAEARKRLEALSAHF